HLRSSACRHAIGIVRGMHGTSTHEDGFAKEASNGEGDRQAPPRPSLTDLFRRSLSFWTHTAMLLNAQIPSARDAQPPAPHTDRWLTLMTAIVIAVIVIRILRSVIASGLKRAVRHCAMPSLPAATRAPRVREPC